MIGGNSYIARSFARRYAASHTITPIRRGEGFDDYFSLSAETFEGYDAVLNCAAIVHDPSADPKLSESINGELPAYLASLAKKAGVPHFIHLSTIAVYGETSFIDAASPVAPQTLYGRTKALGDQKLAALADDGFTVSLIRPPMVYGYGAPGNLHRLLTLLRLFPVLPLGYFKNRHAFIYIENLLSALQATLAAKAGGVLLVCDAHAPSIGELCRALLRASGLRRVLFSPPERIVRFLCTFRALPFAKLYGSLRIDDSHTRRQIGPYASVPFQQAIDATVRGGGS